MKRKTKTILAEDRISLGAPIMALGSESALVRRVKVFHEWFQIHLAKYHIDTLRKAAWQLSMFYDQNKKYKDIEFITSIISTIEFVIQKKGNTDWSVKKAKKDLRGRFSSRFTKTPEHVPMSRELKQALQARITSTADADLQTITGSRIEALTPPFRIR